MSGKLGPLHFRLPFTSEDRALIDTCDVKNGDIVAGWPSDAVAITGAWPAPLNRPLMLRPIFPGHMRFIASDATKIPKPTDIAVVGGKVTEQSLKDLSLTGLLIIRLQNIGHLLSMQKVGKIEAIGEAPTYAFYGPIRLSPDFFRKSLLDFNRGLLAAPVQDKKRRVQPGDVDWEALALSGFLSGSYEPVLRAGATTGDDDAARCPMPEVIVDGDNAFSLSLSVGWTPEPWQIPDAPIFKSFETIPALAFLRHIYKHVRDSATEDAVTRKLFANEIDSTLWERRLQEQLQRIGFGGIADSLPLEQVLREFQIAASGAIATTAKVSTTTPQQLALRNFADLQASFNLAQYNGHISGRANQRTRELINQWERGGQRSPITIVAYNRKDLDGSERPMPTAVPVHNDLWARYDTRDRDLRMFAADFTRLLPGSTVGLKDLELIGYYASYGKKAQPIGGPSSLAPNASRRVDYAEFLPERLLKCDSDDLIAALPAQAGDKLGALASSFKVVRAVSEYECVGYLDQINAYDDAGLSYGPCHWAMAFSVDTPGSANELGAVAAYFHYVERQGIFPGADVFRRQGLRSAAKPRDHAAAMARNAEGGVFRNQMCFLDDRGKARGMTFNGPKYMVPSWRSFYRWVATGRRDQAVGLATWHMALRRLHPLLSVPLVVNDPASTRDRSVTTMGSVFTSELVVAQLMRWHIKTPGALVVGNKDGTLQASPRIVNAYLAAVKVARPNTPDWALAIITALRVELDAFVKKTGDSHTKLPLDFDDLADPNWCKPPPNNSNPNAYTLDQRLRVLSTKEGSFFLAPAETP